MHPSQGARRVRHPRHVPSSVHEERDVLPANRTSPQSDASIERAFDVSKDRAAILSDADSFYYGSETRDLVHTKIRRTLLVSPGTYGGGC